MPKPQEGNNEQEKRLLDFMSVFAPKYQTDSTAGEPDFLQEENEGDLYFGQGGIAGISPGSYEPPHIPDEVEEKISRLKAIAETIKNRVINETEYVALPPGNYKIDYKKSLNPAQYLAATTTKGPVLVIAGAGSGKTRTITYRVSYLLETGVEPGQILLLTFTRRAAQEMIYRTTRLLNDSSAEKVMRGTYHGFANHTLRQNAKLIGLPENFTIIDTVDSEDIISLIRDQMKFGQRHRAFPRKGRIQTIISKARNCDTSVADIIQKEYLGLTEFLDDLELINTAYKHYKAAHNLLDFDDLMEVLRDKLRDVEAFRRKLQKQYRYIMVDEFQDTNAMQKEIIDLLAGGHRNIMVVGDDAQSIYAFRGANFENILTFPETYPDCKVIMVEQNYRSNQGILNFTNEVSNSARLGYKKWLFSNNKNEIKPYVCKFYDQEDEASFIVDQILELREKDLPLNEVAVLYRSTFHGNYVQAELLKRNIPYVVVGGIKFVERRHIKDITSYMRILLNPDDAVSWNRILKLLPGVGKATAQKIVEAIRTSGGKVDFSGYEKNRFGTELVRLREALGMAGRKTITITSKIELLREYYTPLLKNIERADYETRLLDVDVLCQLAAKYDDLERFLSDFALDPPSKKFQDRNAPLIDESEDRPLTLSTIHSSKGLEWHCVFVPHLLDGLFPSTRSLKNIEDMEEERRLFYVACSRAKECLYLTMPSYFTSWDAHFTKPSRFIIEAGKDNFRVWEGE